MLLETAGCNDGVSTPAIGERILDFLKFSFHLRCESCIEMVSDYLLLLCHSWGWALGRSRSDWQSSSDCSTTPVARNLTNSSKIFLILSRALDKVGQERLLLGVLLVETLLVLGGKLPEQVDVNLSGTKTNIYMTCYIDKWGTSLCIILHSLSLSSIMSRKCDLKTMRRELHRCLVRIIQLFLDCLLILQLKRHRRA